MEFIKKPTKRKTTNGLYYVCKEKGRVYSLYEYARADGEIYYQTYVGFHRITSNVFGNGSGNVTQSGWRLLPKGPKRRRLIEWFALREGRDETVEAKGVDKLKAMKELACTATLLSAMALSDLDAAELNKPEDGAEHIEAARGHLRHLLALGDEAAQELSQQA